MAEILNAHGSRNDIFVVPMTPRDFASDDDLRAFARRLCDRAGPFGGDGVYFYDAAPRVPEAWFFNPDGSSAEVCGDGMRCLGRVVLPLAPEEIFVRTFERGAGLTASCGSGMAASRAVYSHVSRIDPGREVTVRNAGGMATVSLSVRDGRWHPVVQGNATLVYRARVDPGALIRGLGA